MYRETSMLAMSTISEEAEASGSDGSGGAELSEKLCIPPTVGDCSSSAVSSVSSRAALGIGPSVEVSASDDPSVAIAAVKASVSFGAVSSAGSLDGLEEFCCSPDVSATDVLGGGVDAGVGTTSLISVGAVVVDVVDVVDVVVVVVGSSSVA
jgi:hypothetical protein